MVEGLDIMPAEDQLKELGYLAQRRDNVGGGQ